ncbi:MAG: hypothetical protein QF511_08565 [Rhodospirillales bacterium]|nr:hypothetical protein [Rhodospirillales bacterium]
MVVRLTVDTALILHCGLRTRMRSLYLCDLGFLRKLIDGLQQVEGLCHQERTKTDPTYRKAGSIEFAEIKRVSDWEFGSDSAQNALILGGRHPDGTVTYLPIPQKDLQVVCDGLRNAENQMKSQKRPKPS